MQIHVSRILTRCVYADPDNPNKFNKGDSGLLAQMQQFPFMTDRLSMTYENGERSGPIDPLFAPEGASYRLSNDRMRYDQQAQGAMET